MSGRLKKIKVSFERDIIVIVQALCVVFAFCAIMSYLLSARIRYFCHYAELNECAFASLSEIRTEYDSSAVMKDNVLYAIGDVARYTVISRQFETDGHYDGNKMVNIGAFAFRMSDEPYTGPNVCYRLDDLLNWGKSNIRHIYRTFESEAEIPEVFKNAESGLSETEDAADGDDTAEEYTEVSEDESVQGNNVKISIEDNNISYSNSIGNNNRVLMVNLVINDYQAVECDDNNNVITDENGNLIYHDLEEYASSIEEYELLSSVLERSIEDLQYNYYSYIFYKDYFNPAHTNVRFYVSSKVPSHNSAEVSNSTEKKPVAEEAVLGDLGEEKKSVFSNINTSIFSETELSSLFQKYGLYVYTSPGKLSYTTKSPLEYFEVQNTLATYSYALDEDTDFWIGIDTSYPANDLFKSNKLAFEHSAKIVPWLVVFTALAFVIFVALFLAGFSFEVKLVSKEGENYKLSWIENLPIELSITIVFVIEAMLVISALLFFYDTDFWSITDSFALLWPGSIFVFLGAITSITLIYSIIRRALCKKLWQKSWLAGIYRFFEKKYEQIRDTFWDIYDGTNIAARVWIAFVVYLLFNVFWVFMFMYSSKGTLCALVLILFNCFVGVALYRRSVERKHIIEGINRINGGEYDYQIDLGKMHGVNKEFANAVNGIANAVNKAVETSTKDEKLKADLITNVSHDIKTPLTSIINYVDLLKRENLTDEKVKNYVQILDEKSQRLKQLTMDLVEASKVSSGNITLELMEIDFAELLNQMLGEFEGKFTEKQFTVVSNIQNESVNIMADPRHMWRIVENLFQNVYKYAMPGTRVYVDLFTDKDSKTMYFSVKNISARALNIRADELTQRFIRGDVARSTEGSGLGLSIAKSLTKAHNGSFDIFLDGDLFKAVLRFDLTR